MLEKSDHLSSQELDTYARVIVDHLPVSETHLQRIIKVQENHFPL